MLDLTSRLNARLRAKDPVYEYCPPQWSPNERVIAKNCLDALCKHYPGHQWGVGVQKEKGGGYVLIRKLDIPSSVGYFINGHNLDPEYKAVVRAGGMLLEAFRLHRGRIDFDEHMALPTTFNGHAFPDPAAVKEHNLGYGEIKKGFERQQQAASAA